MDQTKPQTERSRFLNILGGCAVIVTLFVIVGVIVFVMLNPPPICPYCGR